MLKAILFDFDGTLIDSNKNTTDAFKEAIAHFNYPLPVDLAKRISSFGGLTTYEIWKRLLPDLSHEKIIQIRDHAHQVSLKTISNIETFPDVLSVLKKLKQDYLLALVTSRSKESTEIVFNHRSLHEYFSLVITRDDVKTHKPNPEGILKVMKQLKVLPSETIYVGDAKKDVETAHNAGIACIIISKLQDTFGADYSLKEITLLPAFIENYEN